MMDNLESEPGKYNIIGQIVYHLSNDIDNVDTSIEALFSRVFVSYNQYQQNLNAARSRNYQSNFISEELSEEDEYDIEENTNKENLESQNDIIRQEFDIKWAEIGQDIILKLWIEKYKDFVDPDYIDDGQEDNVHSREQVEIGDSQDNCKETQYTVPEDNCKEIQNTVPEDNCKEIQYTVPEDNCKEIQNTVPEDNCKEIQYTVPEDNCKEIQYTVPEDNCKEIQNTVPEDNCKEIQYTVPEENIYVNQSDTNGREHINDAETINDKKINLDIEPGTTNQTIPERTNQTISVTGTLENQTPVDSTLNDTEEDNGGDFSNAWDSLWQTHCIEVYNSHFETFKQEWLKNLSETLDKVNNSAGLEYFELIKQEVLESSQKRGQGNKTKGTNKSKTFDPDLADEKEDRITKKPRRNRQQNSLANFIENNLNELDNKYVDKEEQPHGQCNSELSNINEDISRERLGEDRLEKAEERNQLDLERVEITSVELDISKEKESVRNKSTSDTEEEYLDKETIEKQIVKNTNTLCKDTVQTGKVSKEAVQELKELQENLQQFEKSGVESSTETGKNMDTPNKRKSEDAANELQEKVKKILDVTGNIVETQTKDSCLVGFDKEAGNERTEIQDSKDSDDSDSDTPNKTPNAAYSKFINEPNYLAKKLGLHFGSGESQIESFYKHQKLSLFISKSKFKTMNHRLKIDTKEELWKEESEEEEEMDGEGGVINKRDEENEADTRQYERETKGYDFKYDNKPYGGNRANKHTYFKYSDDEDDIEEIPNKNETEKQENVEMKLIHEETVPNTDSIEKELSKSSNLPNSLNKTDAGGYGNVSGGGTYSDRYFKTVHSSKETNPNDTLASEDVEDSNEPPEELKIIKQDFNNVNEQLINKIELLSYQCEHKNTDLKQSIIDTRSSINNVNSPLDTAQNGAAKQDGSHNENGVSIQDGGVSIQDGGVSIQDGVCIQDGVSIQDGFSIQDGVSIQDGGDYIQSFQNVVTHIGSKKKKKRKKKKKESYWGEPEELTYFEDELGDNLPDEILANPYLNKYYLQRYLYWSKYDEGIQMDEESWYSVTPEQVALHVASRCKESDVVIDAFCGCGGNTIQFATRCRQVISIDIDPAKLRLAAHNASIYGVSHKIQFILGDFYTLAPSLKGDVVFLSPPWGGPDYARDGFTIDRIFPEYGGGGELYEVAKRISPNVGYYLPRTTNVAELIPLAGQGGVCEIEQNFVSRKFVAITAYYGSLVQKKEKKKKKDSQVPS